MRWKRKTARTKRRLTFAKLQEQTDELDLHDPYRLVEETALAVLEDLGRRGHVARGGIDLVALVLRVERVEADLAEGGGRNQDRLGPLAAEYADPTMGNVRFREKVFRPVAETNPPTGRRSDQEKPTQDRQSRVH